VDGGRVATLGEAISEMPASYAALSGRPIAALAERIRNSRLLNGENMSIATGTSPIQPEPGLLGQTVVVMGGNAGIGLKGRQR
jgi:hypothetical protein